MPTVEARLHGILVTYRRPDELGATLQQLERQSRHLDHLLVVDNDDDPAVRTLVDGFSGVAGTVDYLPAPENVGPAGALHLGTEHLIDTLADSDWVMFLDDDDPPRTESGIADIFEFGLEMAEADPSTGGVGMVGARLDRSSGRLVSVPDEELQGSVPVDYIGGGQLPCYRALAIRKSGLPESRLFFGFDDLEYGLRLGSDWTLYANGDAWREERIAWDRVGIDRSPSRAIQTATWRTYYSTRNLIWILRRHGSNRAVFKVVGRLLAKAAYNSPRSPRLAWQYLRLGSRATFDALTGRLGRRIEPGAVIGDGALAGGGGS